MEILVRAAQLILSLSLLVAIHEFGHFSFARLFNTRVEKFYLFFNPWFSLFKKKIGDTVYGIGWLPLGGYVKIAGMIDESFDREQMKKPAQPWEFRSKPAYQRFFIMFGGVLFNFILAMFIYSMTLYTWGEQYFPIKNATMGIYCDSTALDIGLQHRDKILKVGELVPETFPDVLMELIVDDARTITVERDGREVVVDVPEDFSQKMIASGQTGFVTAFLPFKVDSLIPDKPAALSGLRVNDEIIGIDSISTPSFYDFAAEVKQYAGKTVFLKYKRGGFVDSTELTVSPEGIIGAVVQGYDKQFGYEKREYSFLASIPAGVSLGFETLATYVKQMKLIFTAEGAQQVGGFVSIGSMFPTLWDWQIFWSMTALLSVILAFMNILPIPALDGGHIVFLLYEMITGNKPSERVLEVAQLIGVALLFGLLIFANGNDLIRVIGN